MLYVTSFIFSEDRKKVLLIKKNRPDHLKNKLNGIGGKVESNENLETAISREVFEEAGIRIEENKWFKLGQIDGIESKDHFDMNDYINKNYSIFMYFTISDLIFQAETITDEEIVIKNISDLLYNDLSFGVLYFINLALNKIKLNDASSYFILKDVDWKNREKIW